MQCYDAAKTAIPTTTRRAATEEDLLAMPKDGQKYELVDGEDVLPGFRCRLREVLE